MAMDIKHNLRLQQQLKITITPQLQQAIKLLQLTRLELQQAIQNELEQNPVLEEQAETEEEISQEKSSEEETKESDEGEVDLDTFDLESYLPEEEYQSYRKEVDRSGENGRPVYENTLRVERNLSDHLMEQLSLEDFPPELKEVGGYIVGNIDENGYLTTTVEDTALKCGKSAQEVEEALGIIQGFDPTGVGAQNLRECLMFQAREKFDERSLEMKILEDCFEKFMKTDLAGIARALKLEKNCVTKAMKNLATLDPKPGKRYSSSQVHYITPDIFVFKVGDEWVISLNEDGLPKLRINSYYKELIKKKDTLSKEEKEYLRDKVNSAVWFVKSIYQRKRTIYRVMEAILKNQPDFFDRGQGHLRPLTLKDIADDIEMHESTVSRVTSGKYVHTPHGLFELKYFFTSSLTKRDGESVASESVKEKIKNLVRHENNTHPMSDIEITKVLKLQGINIARRTVTKYRESLGILSSNRRKKVF